MSTPAKSTRVEHRAHLVVGDRVAGPVAAGVDRERDADHLALLVHERAAGVARREPRREHEHLRGGSRPCGRCRCRPRRSPRRRARATRAAARRPGGRRPRPGHRRRRIRARGRGASSDGTRSTARSRTGSNATTVASYCAPLTSSTVVSSSPATTCALVTTSPLVGDPAAPLLDLPARAAAHLHDRRAHASRRPRPGSRRRAVDPGSGGSSSGPSADGYGASEIARPHAANCARLRRRERVDRTRRPTNPRAMRAGQPLAVASDGIIIQTSTSTPTVPIAAPATRSQRGNGGRRRRTRCTSTPMPRPSA